MMINNKFLTKKDYFLVSYQAILKEIEYLYIKVLKKKIHYLGSKHPNQVNIQWCRDWEFPWAIISSEVKSGEKVLDCGCGGSPLLYYLAQYGCEAYGVDINTIVIPVSVLRYYLKHIYDFVKTLKFKIFDIFGKNTYKSPNIEESSKLSFYIILIKFLKGLFKPRIYHKNNNLRFSNKEPRVLGFNVQFFKESVDNMHFKDNTFDKVFCISVIEHLTEEIAFKGIKEMARVLKKGGLLIISLDHDGEHVNPNVRGRYLDLINASGLKLYGESNFENPKTEDIPGFFNVIGFILKK